VYAKSMLWLSMVNITAWATAGVLVVLVQGAYLHPPAPLMPYMWLRTCGMLTSRSLALVSCCGQYRRSVQHLCLHCMALATCM
jgi:hypothetical protein